MLVTLSGANLVTRDNNMKCFLVVSDNNLMR